METLIYRSHEVGTISDATYRRAFQRLNQLRQLGLFACGTVESYPGSCPRSSARPSPSPSDTA